MEPGMAQIYNPSTWEVEVGESGVQGSHESGGQPGILSRERGGGVGSKMAQRVNMFVTKLGSLNLFSSLSLSLIFQKK